ncbi:hypothetical protein CEXT_604601 [Caerostris extrusa]|uniref:EGF-like domain-containing protein n=1 Tax=Caerostris extrusa TaxID=172846 RepID=A0AAV4RPY1_CAEEX|nr:hypothetical protein CEXT_604601 [Caerostris extrusa]
MNRTTEVPSNLYSLQYFPTVVSIRLSCYCGKEVISCTFSEGGKKNCVCEEGYSVTDGHCEEETSLSVTLKVLIGIFTVILIVTLAAGLVYRLDVGVIDPHIWNGWRATG